MAHAWNILMEMLYKSIPSIPFLWFLFYGGGSDMWLITDILPKNYKTHNRGNWLFGKEGEKQHLDSLLVFKYYISP